MSTEKNKTSYKFKNSNENKQLIDELITSGIHPVMAHLYALRGVDSFNQINLLQKLEPFQNMLNIQKAAQMLAEAILKKEKICVVADYDVDGATSCAIAIHGLRMFGARIDFVVPNRFVHGYGLTPSVVDEAIARKNPDLLITVDNGISSHAGVDHAHKKGLKVLVTDHHLPGDTVPDADCIVNPNQKGCLFKSKSMAGCGVMFYVLAATRQRMLELNIYDKKTIPNIYLLLDLVAIGTVADVVKLDLNNRIMVRLGLDLIHRKMTRPGVMALAKVARRDLTNLTTQDIGFGIAPRINAAGRLEDMSLGIQLLLTENDDTAHKLALELDRINRSRKEIEVEMKEQALQMPEVHYGEFTKVAFDESFHEGVIGIVASRIKDNFYRPTIVFAPAQEEGMLKGSGRSIPEVHLRDALDLVSKKDPALLAKFGGHAMAAGLTIKKDDLNKFMEFFEEAVAHFVGNKKLVNVREVDMRLSHKHLNMELAELIRKEVWGQGFSAPLFYGEFEVLNQKIIKEAHLKLTLVDELNQKHEAMWFFRETMIEADRINCVYTLGINEFLNEKTMQISIEDLIVLN